MIIEEKKADEDRCSLAPVYLGIVSGSKCPGSNVIALSRWYYIIDTNECIPMTGCPDNFETILTNNFPSRAICRQSCVHG